MDHFSIDADEGYVAPDIPDANLTIGGRTYKLSSPEPSVWAAVVGMEDEASEETALTFLQATMSHADFAELRERVKDPEDAAVDVFKVIRATTLIGQRYGDIISQHFAALDGPSLNRRQRRDQQQAGTTSIPTTGRGTPRKAVAGTRRTR
ncbi:hypothetical protein ACFC1T_09700 [Kitasatospora sp. NPDC056076]|uniref:hypothetical protein n=1 Tax=Kitasatospora sp. NPDC056076 TaxID=3345703 RepID=UPI0035DA5234